MEKMLNGLFIASIIGACIQGIKEACQPTIPAENWANKELMHQDLMNGVSAEQRLRYAKQGRYYLPKSLTEVHPEPHRDENGKIIIENSQLYYDDIIQYGACQAQQWVKQGNYNLTPEELEKERERIKKEFDQLYHL